MFLIQLKRERNQFFVIYTSYLIRTGKSLYTRKRGREGLGQKYTDSSGHGRVGGWGGSGEGTVRYAFVQWKVIWWGGGRGGVWHHTHAIFTLGSPGGPAWKG